MSRERKSKTERKEVPLRTLTVPRFETPPDDPNLNREYRDHLRRKPKGASWEERSRIGQEKWEEFKRIFPVVSVQTDDADWSLALLLDQDERFYRLATCQSGRHLTYLVVRVRKDRVKRIQKRS